MNIVKFNEYTNRHIFYPRASLVDRLSMNENKDYDLKDMLSFVIMACNNEDSDYVKNAVKNNLDGMVYQKQKKLLLILAIYKVYTDGDLSHSLVEQYLDGGHSNSTPIMDRLCDNITPFIASSKNGQV